MIALLTFGTARSVGGRAVRDVAFEARSTLPLSAACLVANGVREALARSLAREVDVELFEPTLPSAAQRRVLLADALVYRVRGRICDGFVIVRGSDARKLVALAFGETERSEHDALSEIERATLERVVGRLVPLCNSLCGTLGPTVREAADRAASDVATYFEVRTCGAPRIAVGFALTRDPSEDVGETIALDDLSDVRLTGTVVCGWGALPVPTFSRLAPGATIALDTPLGGHGVLRFGDVTFARGTCGVKDGRSVLGVFA